MNPRLHICTAAYYHWTTSYYSSAQVLCTGCHLIFLSEEMSLQLETQETAIQPTHPPTHPPRPHPPPPWGGVGTLGQIAQNQTNPPTHRPRTHPPTPPPPSPVGPPLSKGLDPTHPPNATQRCEVS